MTALVTITSKNQLTLPVSMVALLGLNSSRKLVAKVEGDRLVLKKPGPIFGQLQGLLANHPISKKYSVLKIIEIARRREAQRLGREFEKMYEE